MDRKRKRQVIKMRCPNCFNKKRLDDKGKYPLMDIVYKDNSKKEKDIVEFICPICKYKIPN